MPRAATSLQRRRGRAFAARTVASPTLGIGEPRVAPASAGGRGRHHEHWRQPMTDPKADANQADEPGEGAAGALTQQTEGLDEGVTSAIAGPDWDQELVDDARTSMGGEPMEGDVERGPVEHESDRDSHLDVGGPF